MGPRAAADSLPIHEDFEAAKDALRETGEALHLLRADDAIPLDGLMDISLAMDRAGREGVLDGVTLRDIASTLGAARRLRRYLRRHRDVTPALSKVCLTDPSLDDLKTALDAAVETDGRLKDNASEALRGLRAEVSAIRARLVRRLESLLVKHEKIVQDRFFTIREGRYVVPIRRDAHERLPGIVHGTSSSGASVFVEPRQLVEPGNRLKMAQSEMEREEARILAALTDLVRDVLPALRAAYDALNHADLRAASAKFGVECGADILPLAADCEVQLQQARHPLLLLDGVKVVPNDISLVSGEGIVISGPNAGGKTVALKLVGLVALMMRAGLPVAAAPGSTCGFFRHVLTDVGDHQSIERNLSTFSAHVVNLARILDAAGADSLVLLDELAGSTDPDEGAALAGAILESLVTQGAAVLITTHYDRLKALASSHPTIQNASVGFDAEKMAPTFQLLQGVPGPSSALMVAARYGISQTVMQRARELVPRDTQAFQQLIEELNHAKSRSEEERRAVAKRATELAEQEAKLRKESEALRLEREKLRKQALDDVTEGMRSLEKDVKALRRQLREGPRDAKALETASEKLQEVRTAVRANRPPVEGSPAAPKSQARVATEALAPGAEVWIPNLRKHGKVVETRGPGQVRVAVGPVKLVVSASDLEPARARDATPSKQQHPQKNEPASPTALLLRTTDNTVDLRGMRAEDALTYVETALDRAYGQDVPNLFILHGHGSGALKKAVRDWLGSGIPYVSKYRPAKRDEGGDAFTVVFLT